MEHRVSQGMAAAHESYGRHLGRYLNQSSYDRMRGLPGVIDLAFGDPHEYPASALVELFHRNLDPGHPGWFAYTRDHPPAQEFVAEQLTDEFGERFEPADIALTNGAFGGLVVCLRSVCDPGDEVIYLAPTWFYYESMIISSGATPRRVDLAPSSWRLDPDRIDAAITPSTSAIIINSPNNPTGVIYADAELAALADVLTQASRRYGRPIYLISDEAYRRIVFDDLPCPSPGSFYPFTLLVHTYTKTLLLPGQRIGYIALPPSMPEREQIRETLTISRLMTGWAFPGNSLMYAVPELNGHTISVKPMQVRRNILVDAFTAAGFHVRPSQGTFYLLARTATGDDWAHVRKLEQHGMLALAGSVVGAPGHIRLSLTITDEMAYDTAARVRRAYDGPGGRLSAGQ